jgi:hypothetical protein
MSLLGTRVNMLQSCSSGPSSSPSNLSSTLTTGMSSIPRWSLPSLAAASGRAGMLLTAYAMPLTTSTTIATNNATIFFAPFVSTSSPFRSDLRSRRMSRSKRKPTTYSGLGGSRLRCWLCPSLFSAHLGRRASWPLPRVGAFPSVHSSNGRRHVKTLLHRPRHRGADSFGA